MSEDQQDHDDEQQEIGYRSAWVELLELYLRNLGYQSNEAQHVAWISERERTVSTLRWICAEHGDNNWPDDLHLADVIEKHLARYLEDRESI